MTMEVSKMNMINYDVKNIDKTKGTIWEFASQIIDCMYLYASYGESANLMVHDKDGNVLYEIYGRNVKQAINEVCKRVVDESYVDRKVDFYEGATYENGKYLFSCSIKYE
jgi:hypothetical protein